MKHTSKQLSSQHQVIGFPPLLAGQNEQVTILVLGSVPSVRSLQFQQYYAHPQNAFWWIMGQLFGFDHQLAYEQRHKLLNENGVIVWDVLESCERQGSLDSRIKAESEVPNDIPMLLNHYNSINRIVCNGGTTLALLKRHHSQLFRQNYEILKMPSTSPANARLSKQEKLEQWTSLKLPYQGSYIEH